MLDQEQLQTRLTQKAGRHGMAENAADNTGLTSQTYLGGFIEVPRVSVIIPAKNEAQNLPYVLPLIPAWVYEVMLVDGESTDDTVAAARKLMPRIKIVPQQGKGKGAALRTGFSAASGDIIVMLDADGSTDPREIPAFVGCLISGADFVKGSRFLQGGGTADMGLLRKLGNSGLLFLTRMFFGGNYTDLCFGYNAFWKRVLTPLNLQTDGFEIETEMNIRALRGKLRVAEVCSFEAKRIFGESNLNTFRDGWRVLRTILREAIDQYRTRTDSSISYPAEEELYER